jgi:hypothetical protein
MKTFEELFGRMRQGCHTGGKKCLDDEIRVSVTTEQKNNTGRKSLAFTIGEELMQSMRWVTGDKVTIRMECSKSEATIVRVPESSKEMKWTLTGPKRRDKKYGECCRCRFSVNASPVMLQAFGMDDADSYVPDETRTSTEGITFPLRKQWTVNR